MYSTACGMTAPPKRDARKRTGGGGSSVKSFKTLYFLLSKRAPIREMMEYARDCAEEHRADLYFSTLLHVAQLFPMQPDLLEESDDETRALIARLEELWRPVRPYLSDRLIPPTKRWYSGMRPAGFPTRRLAAVAVLMGRLTRKDGNLFRDFIDTVRTTNINDLSPKDRKTFWKQIWSGIVVEDTDHYFETRFTFGGKKQERPQALLGEPAARSLLFNVFLPMAIVYAREKQDRPLEQNAWRLAFQFPALEANSVVKFMTRRLFSESGREKGLLRQEIFQQAMLKVFSDCCSQNERTCDDCTFLALADRISAKQA
jgi:hypothetical protein